MTHRQLAAQLAKREYDRRGHTLRFIDIEQVGEPHFWDHLPADGYCLDALDKIPAGSMRSCYGFPEQVTIQR